jgi:DNA-binding transcriptional regulator YhcF (GntR family)
MEFNGNKSIYIQICDEICERILTGELEPDMRIPSVREYGAEIGVNPNTVMRSYEKLTSENIIYNRRGIGYFISQDAKQIVLQTMKKDFLENEMPQIIKKMHLLGISMEELQVIEK